MTQIKKKWKDLFRFEDPKLDKVFTWVTAIFLAIGVFMLFVCIIVLISLEVAEPGKDITYYLPVKSFMLILFAIYILLFIAFFAILFYVGLTNWWSKARAEKERAELDSPLTEAAKGHEQQIINLMISTIQPVLGKKTIVQAKTAKFIKAFKELNLMDANLEGQHLIPWIESITGYSAGNTSSFNQALKAVKIDDDDVPKYKAQLKLILNS